MERLSPNSEYKILKTSKKEGYYYSHRKFEYSPPGWIELDGEWFPMGYRVTTTDLKSLGLRKNPTIYTYSFGEWVMEENPLIARRTDNGGIWSGASLSSARKTQSYCLNRKENPFETRIFYAALYNPIFANGYGVKSQGLMIVEELK